MKRKLAILLIGISLFSLIGCGKRREVKDYPLDDTSVDSDVTTKEGDTHNGGTDKVVYSVLTKNGGTSFEINATVTGDTTEPYPVYEVLPKKFTDEEIRDLCDKIFDEGSMVPVLPDILTQADYVEDRIKILNSRKEECQAAGEEIKPYIEAELLNMEERRSSSHMGDSYTIPKPQEIGWIDLRPFFNDEFNMDIECRVCYVDGTIDGTYFRACFTDYQNDIMFRIFKLERYLDEPDACYIMRGTEHAVYDVSNVEITEEDAVEQAKQFVADMGLNGYVPIAVFPAGIYGRTNDEGFIPYTIPDKMEGGYSCYFAREVNGRTRPFNSQEDNYEFIVPRLGALPALSSYEGEYLFHPLMVEGGRQGYRLGYEYLRVNVKNSGVTDCIWNSPSDVGEIITGRCELISFKQADESMRNYLQYYGDTDKEVALYFSRKIDRIQLGMCRVTNDNYTYYMVPAWYYFCYSDNVMVEENVVACVNAIDGSIINVSTGGNTIEYTD